MDRLRFATVSSSLTSLTAMRLASKEINPMGELKNFMMTLEDIAVDSAREGAADAYYIIQDVMHEQRDMVREQIEINMLDYLSNYTYEMDDFFAFMGFEDEDDYHSWLDERASEALAEEGLGDFV